MRRVINSCMQDRANNRDGGYGSGNDRPGRVRKYSTKCLLWLLKKREISCSEARTRKAFLAEETAGTLVAKMTEAIGIDGGEGNLGLL